MKSMKRRNSLVNFKSVHNLCVHCFSRLTRDETGDSVCTGDRLEYWQGELDKFLQLSTAGQTKYLESLSNASGFLSLVDFNTKQVFCGFSNNISPIVSEDQTRIPDPMAVSKLEKKLKRILKPQELEEDYAFEDGYKLPFLNFPEDL